MIRFSIFKADVWWLWRKVPDSRDSLVFFGLQVVLSKLWGGFGLIILPQYESFSTKIKPEGGACLWGMVSLVRAESILCRCPTPEEAKQPQTCIFPFHVSLYSLHTHTHTHTPFCNEQKSHTWIDLENVLLFSRHPHPHLKTVSLFPLLRCGSQTATCPPQDSPLLTGLLLIGFFHSFVNKFCICDKVAFLSLRELNLMNWSSDGVVTLGLLDRVFGYNWSSLCKVTASWETFSWTMIELDWTEMWFAWNTIARNHRGVCYSEIKVPTRTQSYPLLQVCSQSCIKKNQK